MNWATTTHEQVGAELGRAAVVAAPLNSDGPRGWEAVCPTCGAGGAIRWREGDTGWTCQNGCDPSRIADEIRVRAAQRRDHGWSSAPEKLPMVLAATSSWAGNSAPTPEARHRAPDTYPLLDFDGLLTLPDPSFLIDGILPETGLGVLYGAAGSLKSFLALDWACCVGTGRPWHGHQILNPGPVIYIAAEGHGGLPARVRAWWHAHGQPNMSRVRWLTTAVNFRDRAQLETLRRTLAGLPEPPRVLVIDTMARSVVGGDENSAKDVGEFIAAVDSLPADLRLVIHHSGHQGDHERGSSALQCAADFRGSVTRRGPLVELACRKTKDAGEWEAITLRLEPHETGSCTLSRVIETDALRDRIRADTLAFVASNAPASKRAVREGVSGKGTEVDGALDWLVGQRKIERTSKGFVPCPDPQDTLGHTPLRHPRRGPCPGRGIWT